MKLPLYIRGYKELSAYIGGFQKKNGPHKRTLQRWHLERARIQYIKTHPHSSRSKWFITPDRVHVWLKNIGHDIDGQ